MCNWIHSLCFHLLKNVLFYWLYNLLYSSCSKSQNNLLSSTVAKNVSRSAHCLCAVCPVLKGGFFWFLFWSLCFKCWDFHRELHFKSRSINRTVLFSPLRISLTSWFTFSFAASQCPDWQRTSFCLHHYSCLHHLNIESKNGLGWKRPYKSSVSKFPAMIKDTFHQIGLLRNPTSLTLNDWLLSGMGHPELL